MTATVLDDQAVSRWLRQADRPAASGADLYTTGYWYVRLCQAVLAGAHRPGALSGPFLDLPPELRERTISSLLDLPDEIGTVSLRTLAPLMGRLRARYELNVLSTEALAATLYLGAEVVLSAPSPRLEAALWREGAAFRSEL